MSKTAAPNRAYWVAIAAATAVFALMSSLTTLKDDDIIYTFIDNSGGMPMTSLTDVLRSHASHFITTNGRFANFLAQLFCGLLGKAAFDVCNAAVFALTLHLTATFATGGGSRPAVIVALTFAFVMLSFPNPGETMMWLTGSVNYLWAVVATLALWWWLRSNLHSRIGAARCTALFIASAVAGNMNEATSFGFFTGMALWVALDRSRLTRASVVAMCGYLAGIAVIVASPGAWERLDDGGTIVGGMSLAHTALQRLYITGGRSALYVFPALMVVWAAACLLRLHFTARLRDAVNSDVWCVFAGSLLWMLLLGVNRSRAFTFYAMVSFIGIAAVVWRAVEGHRRWQQWATAALVAASMWPAAKAVGVLWRFRAYDRGVKEQIAAAPSQAVIEASVFREENRFLMPVCYYSPNYYIYNTYYCYYFHKANVQFLPSNVLRRYRSGRMLEGGRPMAQLSSSMPAVAGTVYEFPGEDFAVVPLSSPRYTTTMRIGARITTSSGLDAKEMQRRYMLGLGTDSSPINTYHVLCHGRAYLVLPALPPTVSSISLPLPHAQGLKFIRIE